MKYCPNCKQEAGDDMLFCMSCGSRLLEKTAPPPPVPPASPQRKWNLLTTVFAVLFVLMTVLFINAKDSEEYYYEKYLEARGKISTVQGKADFMDAYVVIVFDDGTKYYHTYDCYKNYSGSFWAYNIEAAQYKGYDPCPDCH